jgi:two-component system NtrC family sensor kinase
MASGMCHELNNPLTTVKGFAEIIANSANLNEDEKLKMKKILTAAERMRAIVDHLRVFSRSPKQIDRKTVSVRAPITDAFDFFEPQLKLANIKTVLEIEKEVNIYGDHNQIESVFHNLIGDSRDAFQNVTDSREKVIRIRVDMRPDNQVDIKYEDNASGMSPEVAVKIFDPFFTTKTQGEGTGLGLTVSHGIIARHGGNITVNSQIGKGSSFFITLPCPPV